MRSGIRAAENGLVVPVGSRHNISGQTKGNFNTIFFTLVKFSLISKGLQIHIELIIQQIEQTVQQMGEKSLDWTKLGSIRHFVDSDG